MRKNPLPSPESHWSVDDARRVLDAWSATGQSIAAFAREHGVTARRLYWWRGRLDEQATSSRLELAPATIVRCEEERSIVVRLANGTSVEIANASASMITEIIGALVRSS